MARLRTLVSFIPPDYPTSLVLISNNFSLPQPLRFAISFHLLTNLNFLPNFYPPTPQPPPHFLLPSPTTPPCLPMPIHPRNNMSNAPSPHPDPPYHSHYRPPPNPLHHPPSPPLHLSDTDIALLSQTYSDFFSSLRSNTFTCQWILQGLLTSTPIDTSTLNISLSRGYRSVYMCATQGCASIDSQTLLQKKSTLLLPVHSRDSVVVGYYVESSRDQATSESLRMGRYVYDSAARSLLKVSKVRGPPSSSDLISICVNRTNIVGDDMFIKDFVMLSFPWQADTTQVPSQCIVHSRTLAFRKLSQTAQQAGLAGHGSHPGAVAAPDMGVPESSFFGLVTFGVYDCIFIPSRLCSGMRADGAEPSFSIGSWAMPEHCSFCRGQKFLHVGMFREELASLRSHFNQAYGQQSPLTNRFSANPSSTFDSNGHTTQARALQHTQGLQDERRQRTSQNLTDYPQHTVGYDNGVAADFEYDKEVTNTTVPTHSTAPLTATAPISLTPVPPRHGTVLTDTATNREIAVGSVASGLPTDLPTSVMLPTHRLASTAPPYHPVYHTLHENPSSVVDTIEAVVPAQQQTAGGKRVAVSTSAATSSVATSSVAMSSLPGQRHSAPPSFSAPVASKEVGAENKPPAKKEQSFSMQAFKKTLPAPTKSEIVIRNRISAQRSNEKRRRKIEATKTELAYLKTTYLPQLENKKGCLITENQSLKLKFMGKYHESDIESFF